MWKREYNFTVDQCPNSIPGVLALHPTTGEMDGENANY